MTRSRSVFRQIAAATVTACLVQPPIAVQAQARAALQHTLYNTPLPTTIHIAIRAANNPRGQIQWVQTVGFEQYCRDVLPNEWYPSWNAQSLLAGAIAVKMFGWYHRLHPVTIGGYTFDVDNTTNFQQYRYMSGRPPTDQAVTGSWHTAYTYADGSLAPLDYRAGAPNSANWPMEHSEHMAEWGSQYWALTGRGYSKILAFYFTARTFLPIP